jgi:hypothetical protein
VLVEWRQFAEPPHERPHFEGRLSAWSPSDSQRLALILVEGLVDDLIAGARLPH